MGFDAAILKRVLARFAQRRRNARAELNERREEVYRELPRVREIDAELARTMIGIARAALQNKTDPMPVIQAAKMENLKLQNERAQVLREAGFTADCLEEKPDCPVCGDTGYIGSRPCECLLRAYAREQAGELSSLLDIGGQSFDRFDFSLFSEEIDPEFGCSPRQNIDRVYDVCSDYAHSFGAHSDNLFISGLPGRGKTYLSGCIAGEVSQSGFSVVYDTAIHIFERFEAGRFAHDGAASEDISRYLSCDLLIIDDLGTEFTSPFTVSALYHIVNSRLSGEKKTIINSNLTIPEMSKRYSPQILSRIDGNYLKMHLFGDDIRQKLKFDRGYG